MTSKVSAAIFIGLIVMVVVIAIPAFIEAPNQDVVQSVEIDEGSSEDINERISVSVDAITGEDADIRVQDSETGETQTETIALDGSYTYEFDGGDISVTVTEVTDTSVVTTVGYPTMFGWSDGAIFLGSNLGIFTAILGLVLIVSGLIVGMD